MCNTPLAGLRLVTHAGGSDPKIPQTLLITTKDLLTLCDSAKISGKKYSGLLSTGEEQNDSKITVKLGKRENIINYYGKIFNEDKKDTALECVYPGDIEWLVAGSDSDNTVVLISEKPLLGHDSKFHTSNTNAVY